MLDDDGDDDDGDDDEDDDENNDDDKDEVQDATRIYDGRQTRAHQISYLLLILY